MNTLPRYSKVLVDGQDLGVIKECYPKGSVFHLFPHYVIDLVEGERIIVSLERVKLTPES